MSTILDHQPETKVLYSVVSYGKENLHKQINNKISSLCSESPEGGCDCSSLAQFQIPIFLQNIFPWSLQLN